VAIDGFRDGAGTESSGRATLVYPQRYVRFRRAASSDAVVYTMPHRDVSRYNPLVAYLRVQPPHDLTLPLTQIAALIGGPLPNSAHVDGCWWHLPTNPAVRAWEALGWRAYLNARAHAVTFRCTTAALREGHTLPPRTNQTAWPSRFAPLIAYLTAWEEETLTLTFTAIEALIGKPLSTSAQVSPGWWVSTAQRHVRDLRAIGWRARLDMKQRAVAFRRVGSTPAEG
jgi:hypothetical protein